MFPLSLAGCTRLKALCRSIGYSFYSSDKHTARPFQIPAHAAFKKKNRIVKKKKKEEGRYLRRNKLFKIIYQQVEKFDPATSINI